MTSHTMESESLERQLRFACGEVNRRLRLGEVCSAEELLASFPGLAAQPDLAMELIYTEFLVRQQLNQSVVPEQWYERFPQWRDDLRQLFEVHEAVCEDELSASRRVGDGSAHASRSGRSSSDLDPQPAVMRRVGNYELLEEIGRGGMGVVYRARQIGLNRIVAVKMILAGEHASEGELFRFRKEAEAAARLQHPGIVQIHEVGTHEGLPFFSMEFVEGGNLQSYLIETSSAPPVASSSREPTRTTHSAPVANGNPVADHSRSQGRFAPTMAAQLIESLARAVHYAHGQGVIHRDLKPANVLLVRPASSVTGGGAERGSRNGSSSGDSMRTATTLVAKITDFGLAKCLSDSDLERTRSGAMLGTPAYMAPEQAAGRSGYTGPATDVYALGAVLYELLTGRPAFQGASWLDTLEHVRTREPARPSRLVPSLPRDLQTICLKCLEKEPGRRYASAELLADDLDRFLKGEPILAEVVSTSERVLKWAKRRPAIAALGALVAVVSLLGFAGVFWQWREAVAGRAVAEDALDDAYRARRTAMQRQQEATVRGRQADQARQLAESEQTKAIRRLYFQRVAAAQGEWQNHQIAHADQLLNECPPEYRNWEWSFLKTRCHGEILDLRGHSDVVWSVAYSPDGKHIASGTGQWGIGRSGEIILWDAQTGEAKFPPLRGHTGAIMGMVFSPDGQSLASCAAGWEDVGPGWVIVWDVASGEERFRLPWPLGKSGHGIAYSPDGKTLAVGHWDDKIRLWNAQDGSPLDTLSGHKGVVFEVSFSPDGKWLASVGRDGAAYVWDLATRKPIHSFTGYGDLRCCQISPDGRYLVFTNFGQKVFVWDITKQPAERVALHYLRGDVIKEIDFAPEGRRLAVCSKDGAVRIIDLLLAHELKSLHVHTGPVHSVAFSPDGRRLVTGGMDRTVKVSDATTEMGSDKIRATKDHYYSLTYTPDSKYLLLPGGINRTNSASPPRKSLVVWNVAESRVEREIPGHDSWLTDVACSADGTRFVTSSNDHQARVWDAATGKKVAQFSQHAGVVNSVAISPDGQRTTSTSNDGTIRTWLTETGAEQQVRRGHAGRVASAAYSSNGEWLASGGVDREVLLWKVDETEPHARLEGHDGPITRVVFSPREGDMLLASASQDGTIRLWDAETLASKHVLHGHLGPVNGIAFSPDGKRLASCSDDWTVKLWDVESGEGILTLHENPWLVLCVAFSPDGQQIASASEWGVTLWNSQSRAPWPAETRAFSDVNEKWHRRAASECERDGLWASARFHVERLLAAHPESLVELAHLAYVTRQQGDSDQADQAYAAVMRIIDERQSNHYFGAVLAIQRGNRDDYRRMCAAACKRIKADTTAGVLNEVLWICSLDEQPEANLPPLISSIQPLVEKLKGILAARCLNSMAAAYCRTKQYEEAITALERGIKQRDGVGVVEDWLLLAQCHAGAGHREQARAMLDKSIAWLSEFDRGATTSWTQPVLPWEQRLECGLLMRQAERAYGALANDSH